ncbi:iron complex transport system permease protein [Lishizhenia tianjinensis]|uniref:Iron complex transport system permease protein n=1 Tax=Lishizhenia tianjinensis TaxID=477690 RepID=A0A1I6Y399_9FLAO|nr:iron ABC transporter permease [Lishizhenia tianjinensis]SFT44887.1 iron complex transport system permease protein [Lishizhenia tianjinensis]
MTKKERITQLGLGALVLLSSLYIALANGVFEVELTDVFAFSSTDALARSVFYNIRLPRVIFSFIVGFGLASAGLSTQSLFKNDLADPNILGISSGSILLVACLILFLPQVVITNYYALPVAAFIGAFLVSLLIFTLFNKSKGNQVIFIVILGIAVNALAMSLVALLVSLSNDTQMRNITFWSMGDLGGGNYLIISLISVVLIPAVYFLQRNHKKILLLSLGDHAVKSLGLHPKRIKMQTLILVSLVTAISVSFCGIIGFVGLAVPHIVKLVIGPTHKYLMLYSAFAGGILLVLADTLSRTLIAPEQIPVGIVTSIVGCPVFIYLILKKFFK